MLLCRRDYIRGRGLEEDLDLPGRAGALYPLRARVCLPIGTDKGPPESVPSPETYRMATVTTKTNTFTRSPIVWEEHTVGDGTSCDVAHERVR